MYSKARLCKQRPTPAHGPTVRPATLPTRAKSASSCHRSAASAATGRLPCDSMDIPRNCALSALIRINARHPQTASCNPFRFLIGVSSCPRSSCVAFGALRVPAASIETSLIGPHRPGMGRQADMSSADERIQRQSEKTGEWIVPPQGDRLTPTGMWTRTLTETGPCRVQGVKRGKPYHSTLA